MKYYQIKENGKWSDGWYCECCDSDTYKSYPHRLVPIHKRIIHKLVPYRHNIAYALFTILGILIGIII